MNRIKQLLIISVMMLLFQSKSFAQSNYQQEIKSAYREALLTTEGVMSLKKVHQSLEKLFAQDKSVSQLNYWLSYNEYYMAKFYQLKGKKAVAKSLLETGIKRLEGLSEKSAEDYALLSFLQHNYTKCINRGHIPQTRKMAEENCHKALAIEPRNLRANVVLGMIISAKPYAPGRAKESEDYLLKAINDLSDQILVSDILPSWGKEEAYETLIRNYIKTKRKEEALDYIEEFAEYYPMNLHLDELKALLR